MGIKEDYGYKKAGFEEEKEKIRSKKRKEILPTLTAMQKYPHPGQQWCLTMCDRWASQRTMRGTRLDGRIVSPFTVRLVQALSWQTVQERLELEMWFHSHRHTHTQLYCYPNLQETNLNITDI